MSGTPPTGGGPQPTVIGHWSEYGPLEAAVVAVGLGQAVDGGVDGSLVFGRQLRVGVRLGPVAVLVGLPDHRHRPAVGSHVRVLA